MANITPNQLVASQALSNVASTLYTVPNNTTIKVTRAVFCNTSANAITITVGLSNSGAISFANTILSSYTLGPGQSYVSPELSGAVLASGYQIVALASTSGFVSINISGLTIQ